MKAARFIIYMSLAIFATPVFAECRMRGDVTVGLSGYTLTSTGNIAAEQYCTMCFFPCGPLTSGLHRITSSDYHIIASRTLPAAYSRLDWSSELAGDGDVGKCYQGWIEATNREDSNGFGSSSFCIHAPKPPCWGCSADGTPPVEYVGTPLVVNTGNGPWVLSGVDDAVLFDINADGRADRMAWTARDSSLAFVARDGNGNGRIDDASELFGDHTRLPNGAAASNGFAALKTYDQNGDDVIDADDAVWSNLLLWTDANHDGTSQSSELTTIASSTIRGLSTEYRRNGRTDSYGNEFRFKSQVIKERGREPYYDIFFRVAP